MRVYVHGNCQAPAIASMISSQYPDWEVASFEVFNRHIINEIDRYHHLVKAADIIISQPIQDRYRDRDDLSLNWIRATANPAAALVVYPSMYFDGQLVGLRSVGIPGYGMDYHDALLFHFAAVGLEMSKINDIFNDSHLYSDNFIEQEIMLSIKELKRREIADRVDVPLSPFVEEYAPQTQLFHVINHPCRPALAYIASHILRYLGYPGTVPPDVQEYLILPHVPLSHSVIRFITNRGQHPAGWPTEDSENYRIPSGVFSRPDYLALAVSHLRTYPTSQLMTHLQDHRMKTFLSRLAKSNPSLPEIGMWGT